MYRLRAIGILFCCMCCLMGGYAGAQPVGRPPDNLHVFFCHQPQNLPTAWERWLRMKKPKKLFLPEPHFDLGMTEPRATPSTPEDDPFGKNLKVYNRDIYVFGLSGAKGFNLRNWPRTWPQIRRFLSWTNLFNFKKWLPQPESNPLRMQNMIGASFYFHF